MKESYSLYEEVQILLAGIRLFRHRENRLPSLKELSEFIRFSPEAVHHLCNRLEKMGAVERIRGAFDDRISLGDPSQVESLRDIEESPQMEEEVRKWKAQKESSVQDIEKMFSGDYGKKEKEDLFSDIEDKIKKGGREDKKSPLDALFQEDMVKKS